MCQLVIAALIAVTLKRKGIIPEGSNVFKGITPNISSTECNFKEEALSDESKHTVVRIKVI